MCLYVGEFFDFFLWHSHRLLFLFVHPFFYSGVFRERTYVLKVILTAFLPAWFLSKTSLFWKVAATCRSLY